LDKLRFDDILMKNGFAITEREYNLLVEFVRLLLDWNTKINLVSRKDVENIWQKHILGSLAILFNYKFQEQSSIVDVGTGGGFPGIPLAICLPECSFLLVDSIQKKINVVADIIEKLELKNTTAICGRAEELNMKAVYNRKYTYVTARAVAPVSDVVGWTKMFLRTSIAPPDQTQIPGEKRTISSGSIIIFKGGDVTAELEQARIKQNPKSIETLPLIIEGVELADFTDKKLVVIRP